MDELNEKIKRVFSDLRIRCAYNMPSFCANSGKDYKVIPTKYANGYQDALEDAEREITEVLSAQPQPCQNHTKKAPESDTFVVKAGKTCSDTISKQEAIDALNRHLDTIPVTNNNTMEMIRRSEVMDCRVIINGLPSAETEIIRCKDCKDYQMDWATSYPNRHYCATMDSFMPEDGFCSYAERREE